MIQVTRLSVKWTDASRAFDADGNGRNDVSRASARGTPDLRLD